MRADARGSADTIYCMWRICGPGIVNDVTKVGHAQNIYYQGIVLWCLLDTLTLRRNLISLATFNAIFFKLVVAYFFGPPCIVIERRELWSVVVSKNRNNENASKPSGNWCLGRSTGGLGVAFPEKLEIVIAKSYNLVHFGVRGHFNNLPVFSLEMIPGREVAGTSITHCMRCRACRASVFPLSCAAAHMAKKSRARAVIFNIICAIYIWWESSSWTPDFCLESGDWM